MHLHRQSAVGPAPPDRFSASVTGGLRSVSGGERKSAAHPLKSLSSQHRPPLAIFVTTGPRTGSPLRTSHVDTPDGRGQQLRPPSGPSVSFQARRPRGRSSPESRASGFLRHHFAHAGAGRLKRLSRVVLLISAETLRKPRLLDAGRERFRGCGPGGWRWRCTPVLLPGTGWR